MRPICQIRLYKEEIYNLYCPRLNDKLGMAAITAGLIFTKIPRREANGILFSSLSEGMRKHLEKYLILGSEIVSERNIGALIPVFRSWGKKSPSTIMSSDTAADIRGWLQEPGFSQDQRKPIRLNLDQQEVARVRTASGYRRVKGPAGSGKSLALAARAAELASQEKHVLVCTFNITLVNYLRDLVSRYIQTRIGQRKTRRKVVRRRIDFRHFHGWCKWVCMNAGLEVEEEYSSLWARFRREDVLNTQMANLVTPDLF